MTSEELGELAGRLTLAEFVRLGEVVLRECRPDVQWACIQAHVSDGIPDVMIPLIPRPPAPSPKPRRPARP